MNASYAKYKYCKLGSKFRCVRKRKHDIFLKVDCTTLRNEAIRSENRESDKLL